MVVDTLGGRMHVRWDSGAAATPHGQLVFFAEFLGATGVFERWVSACPLEYRSGNAPDKRDVLGTLMLGLLAGHRRYAHITALLPLIKAGRLRALATTGRGRWAGMSELPTVAESGFAGFEALAWNGFVAPAGTPREWLERLNREINAIVSAPDFKPRAEAAGWDVAGGSIEAFAGFMRAERVRWAPVVKRSGAKID